MANILSIIAFLFSWCGSRCNTIQFQNNEYYNSSLSCVREHPCSLLRFIFIFLLYSLDMGISVWYLF